MKYPSLALVISCAILSGQTSPDPEATKRLEQRLKTLNLLPPPKVGIPVALSVRVNSPCAIPLLTFVPKENHTMPLVKPPADSPGQVKSGGEVRVPAPACELKLFQNN